MYFPPKRISQEKTEMRGIWFKLQYKEFRLDIKSVQKVKYQQLKSFIVSKESMVF